MAIIITEECINCGACEPECPNTAIYEAAYEWKFADGTSLGGDVILPNGKNVNAEADQEPISDEFYFISPDKCTECKGFHEEPQCAAVCPVDCCVPDDDNVETEKELLSKQKFMHPDNEYMKAGIVGLPNVGKSTLFNCLSSTKAQSANFPFCTIEPNIGIINVPDKRLTELESYVNPEKVVPANVEIVDIAGLVKGASKGEGLGNQFLANIRETDAIIHVLRCFDDNNIIHVENTIDPVRDKEIIDLELQLKDLETLEKRKEKLSRLIKTGNKDAAFQNDVLVKMINHLQTFNPIRSIELTVKEQEFSNTLDLITNKPVLYVCNVDESSAINGNEYVNQVKEAVKNENSDLLVLAVATEADINELDNYDDRKAFLDDIGLSEAGSSKLIKKSYDLLNLQTYFTAGEKEVRAWTIDKGMTAPQAAGVIHTDFEKGFIRAEVISFNDYSKYKNEIKVKEAGKLNIEGKDYVVNDGDVMHFRFNV